MSSTWIKLHDNFFSHPKTVGLSTTAVTIFIRCICYSSQHLTDGAVPMGAIESWGITRWRHAIDTLATRSLVTVSEGCLHVHDYLDYQRSAEDARQLSKKRASAGAKGGAAKAAKSKQTPSKVPDPVVAEKRREDSSSSPPRTETGTLTNGAACGGDEDFTATIEHMARCDLTRAKDSGSVIANEAAWMAAARERRIEISGDAVRHQLEHRTGGIHYPIHIEAAEAVDERCGPADGGKARADALAFESASARAELEADLAASRSDPTSIRSGAAAARAALQLHPDQGAA